MKPPAKPILETYQKLQTTEKHIQLREIKGHYYVYRTHSKWDKQRKKPVKTTELLGAITPDGEYKPKRPKTRLSTTKVYQYGNAQLLLSLSQDLRNATTDMPLGTSS
jgi:hypothetical protein